MKTLLPILTALLPAVALCVGGCGQLQRVHEAEGVRLNVYGQPSIDDTGYTLHLDFELRGNTYRETIQRITFPDERAGWVGVESHWHYAANNNRMYWADRQSATRSGVWKHRRVNTVSPGSTLDAPWCTLSSWAKGVCMLDGWLDDNGEPVGNRLYFAWGGRQGGRIIAEDRAAGFTYETIAWSSTHPDNPVQGRARLRLHVLDEQGNPIDTTRREWTGD